MLCMLRSASAQKFFEFRSNNFSNLDSSTMTRQDELRLGREAAIRSLNAVARDLDLNTLPCRPSPDAVTQMWGRLCKAAVPENYEALEAARTGWLQNNGGGSLPTDLLHGEAFDDVDHGSGVLEGHRTLAAALPVPKGKKAGFRLRSKAFMLTFNSIAFKEGKELWDEFLGWIHTRVTAHGATEWSAAAERSTHSSDEGRVHLHVYFSWIAHKGAGVDHSTTDEWVFRGTRPRVDVNSDNRGLYQWRKAAQRGHFYLSAHKEGALYSTSNYSPWESSWVPETHWVTALYRQHKLGHDAYLLLSARLREGHDRRRAAVEAVRATEASAAFVVERAWARKQLQAKALPFKPLCPQIEAWRASYKEVEERYQILVLHGPSRTGKSRLARSLFGLEHTLVVDVQHAEHPDLRGYRRSEHKAILLDEVASPKFIVGNKKVLQAHVDGALLGQSATQLFTYEVFVWRTPIILTTNNWKLDCLAEDEVDWVNANCVVVHVDQPVFVTAAGTKRASTA